MLICNKYATCGQRLRNALHEHFNVFLAFCQNPLSCNESVVAGINHETSIHSKFGWTLYVDSAGGHFKRYSN